jgi:NAD-dependent protein deacetylases, SIR2 family
VDCRRALRGGLDGAGISTDSGIPDFRGPQGVWTKNPEAEKMATLQHYMADPEIRRARGAGGSIRPLWPSSRTPAIGRW